MFLEPAAVGEGAVDNGYIQDKAITLIGSAIPQIVKSLPKKAMSRYPNAWQSFLQKIMSRA